MTNKEVLKKMLGVDFDSTNLKVTCRMLRCTNCPRQYDDNCLPYQGTEDVTEEWLEMEWR